MQYKLFSYSLYTYIHSYIHTYIIYVWCWYLLDYINIYIVELGWLARSCNHINVCIYVYLYILHMLYKICNYVVTHNWCSQPWHLSVAVILWGILKQAPCRYSNNLLYKELLWRASFSSFQVIVKYLSKFLIS